MLKNLRGKLVDILAPGLRERCRNWELSANSWQVECLDSTKEVVELECRVAEMRKKLDKERAAYSVLFNERCDLKASVFSLSRHVNELKDERQTYKQKYREALARLVKVQKQLEQLLPSESS